MRIKTLVALYFWILKFDDVTCIRSIVSLDSRSHQTHLRSRLNRVTERSKWRALTHK